MANNDEELEKILKEIKAGKEDASASEPEFEINEENGQQSENQEAESLIMEDASAGVQDEEAVEEKFELQNENSDESFQEEEGQEMVFSEPEEIREYTDEYEEEEEDLVSNSNKKKIVIIAAAVILVVAAVAGICFGVFYEKEEPTTTTEPATTTTTTEAPVSIKNPLTGETDYNESAVGKRPVAIVVESSPQARPQYNMDTPDIIVEGEVEGGITRMLWIYADMENLPEQVGPTRSARPSYVEFSEFFDSVFVHFGESHSKGDYTGADDVIKRDNVDNINGMSVSSCFKRTSDKASPHNAVLLGDKLVEAIEKKGYRTELDEKSFTAFAFNDSFAPVSDAACSTMKVKVSSRTDTHTLTYDSADKVYTTSDYKQQVKFTNVIVMFADTTYVDKNDYKGSGKTETYCNYNYTSGTGKLASGGAVVDFNWVNEDGILKFTNAETGKELMLNPGNSWLCLASANHEGSVTVE